MNHQNFMESGFHSQNEYNFPNILNVNVIRGYCPCQCVHCPVGIAPPENRLQIFGDTEMRLDLFKKIIREAAAHHHATIRIHGVGEPIIWKELVPALEYSFEKKVRTWIFTCLITNNQALLEKLVKFCNIIEISINSYDKDNYHRTKGVDHFSLVKKNIEFLKEIIKSQRLSTRLIVSRVESEDKQYDKDFINYWKKSNLIDDVFIRSYHNYNDLLDNKFNQTRKEIIPCLVHWSRFNIDCDGTVVLCFNELFKGSTPIQSLVLGNINQQKIANIWHGEKLELVRKAQMQKDYSMIKFTDKLPCIDCFSCQPLGVAGKPTSEKQIFALSGKNPDE